MSAVAHPSRSFLDRLVDLLVAVLRFVTDRIPVVPEPAAYPPPDLDPERPITLAAIADRLGLTIVEGAPDQDLRGRYDGEVQPTVRATLRGARAGRAIELTIRRSSLGGDACMRVAVHGRIPVFECGGLGSRATTPLPLVALDGLALADGAFMRASDPTSLAPLATLFVPLTSVPIANVISDGRSLRIVATPYCEALLVWPERLLSGAIALLDAVDARAADEGATDPAMQAVREAPFSTPPRGADACEETDAWNELLPGGTVDDPGPHRASGLGGVVAAYRQSWLAFTWSDFAGLACAAIFVVPAIIEARNHDWLLALVCVPIGLACWAHGSVIPRRRRIVLRERGFEWHRAILGVVSVRFEDVVAHRRVVLTVRRRSGRASYALLKIALADGSEHTLEDVPGMAQLSSALTRLGR